MRTIQVIASALLILLGLAPEVSATNRVLIESKTVGRCQSGVTAGIYIENDVDLSALLIPLVIRSVNPGAFVANSLTQTSGGRLATFEALGTYVVTESYSATGVYAGHHTCPVDASGHIWNSTERPLDFKSPDAILYFAANTVDSAYLSHGSDGSPGSGTPSILLTFDVACDTGCFEIDTTCVPPFNHVQFYVDPLGNTRMTPQVTKGVIRISGSIPPPDTLTGTISSDKTIRGHIALSGDVTIPSGVTLTVGRNSRVAAIASQDNQHGGLDNARVELIISGVLAIDTTHGNIPTFSCSNDSVGKWYGLRLLAGGHLRSGIGAVIKNARVGVRIERSTQLDTLSGLTIRNCDSIGVSNAGQSFALCTDSIFGLPSTVGIYVDSAGPLIKSCYVESCGTGIKTRFSGSTIRGTRIIGPGSYGIQISSPSDLQLNGKDPGQGIPVNMAQLSNGYYIDLKGDTISGYFSTKQLWMDLFSGHCTIDSCCFVHPGGVQRSPYSLYLNWNDTVTVRRSSITGFSSTGVYSSKAKVDLGTSPGDLGNNNISSDSAGCGGCLLRRVSHSGTDSLKAEGNWWGSATPSSGWFSGKVDWNPYLGSPPPTGKLMMPDEQAEPEALPQELICQPELPEPVQRGYDN